MIIIFPIFFILITVGIGKFDITYCNYRYNKVHDDNDSSNYDYNLNVVKSDAPVTSTIADHSIVDINEMVLLSLSNKLL